MPPSLPPARAAVDEEDFVAEDDDALAARACRKDVNSSECEE